MSHIRQLSANKRTVILNRHENKELNPGENKQLNSGEIALNVASVCNTDPNVPNSLLYISAAFQSC